MGTTFLCPVASPNPAATRADAAAAALSPHKHGAPTAAWHSTTAPRHSRLLWPRCHYLHACAQAYTASLTRSRGWEHRAHTPSALLASSTWLARYLAPSFALWITEPGQPVQRTSQPQWLIRPGLNGPNGPSRLSLSPSVPWAGRQEAQIGCGPRRRPHPCCWAASSRSNPNRTLSLFRFICFHISYLYSKIPRKFILTPKIMKP